MNFLDKLEIVEVVESRATNNCNLDVVLLSHDKGRDYNSSSNNERCL